MRIASPAFGEGEAVPTAYTCQGKNISPPLEFGGIPAGTRSLVLTVEDADSGPPVWIHWFVYNIPPGTRSVKEGVIPAGGTQGLCNNKTIGYEGPCPRYFKGTHHYQFNLYALSLEIESTVAVSKTDVADIIADHTLGQVTLTGTATRSSSRHQPRRGRF